MHSHTFILFAAAVWPMTFRHAAADGEHEAVGLEQPLRLNVPAVAALHPRDYLALEALGRSGVAEGARGDVALERCGYLGREGELHLRDAEVYGVQSHTVLLAPFL